MLFLISELKKYVDLKNISDKKLTDIFTSLAFEVEETIPANVINGVKFANVLGCEKHPNADKLNFCKTLVDKKEIKVVCGAKNIKDGQLVAHAIPGSKVNDLELSAKDLRGVKSNGMILSISEIMGISKNIVEETEKQNIFVFDKNIDTNKSIEDILDIKGSVFDLSILPDRQYASSYFAMARELASYLDVEYNWKIEDIKRNLNSKINIKLNKNATAVYATNVKLKPSKTPFYIKRVLYHSGIQPKNNIEDIMSYANLITGAVTYVVDKTSNIKLDGRKLNNNIDIFNSDSLLTNKNDVTFITISSNEKSIISNEPKANIFFGYKNIRGTSPLNASNTSKFILKIAKNAGYIKDASLTYHEEKINNREFIIDEEYIFNYIGKKIDINKLKPKLEKIGIIKNKNKYLVPDYRKDIFFNADIIEEILRLYGIKNIAAQKVISNKKINKEEPHKLILNSVVDTMVDYGFIETKTYQLLNEKDAKKYNIWNLNKFVKLRKEYTLEHNTLQTSLLSGLINSFKVNHRNDKKDIRLFEISNVFHNEKPKFSLGIIHDEEINSKEPILATKEIIFKSLESLNINLEDITFKQNKLDIFNPYVSAKIFYKNKVIGLIGEIHPSILREHKFIRLDKIKAKLYYAEIILENLI